MTLREAKQRGRDRGTKLRWGFVASADIILNEFVRTITPEFPSVRTQLINEFVMGQHEGEHTGRVR